MNPNSEDSTPAEAVSVCGRCNEDDHWIHHRMKYCGEYHRFCTSCILKLNPCAFCPECFTVYDSQNPSKAIILCYKCGALTHTSCVAPSKVNSPYLCPTCSNPGSLLFDNRKPKSAKLDSYQIPSQQNIDLKSSNAFLAAAKIVANSLKKEAEIAQAKAEYMMKEWLLAKKKAQEALGELAMLWAQEKESSRPTKTAGIDSGSGVNIKMLNYSVEIEKKQEVGESSVAIAQDESEEASKDESTAEIAEDEGLNEESSAQIAEDEAEEGSNEQSSAEDSDDKNEEGSNEQSSAEDSEDKDEEGSNTEDKNEEGSNTEDKND